MDRDFIMYILAVNFIVVVAFFSYKCIWKKEFHRGVLLSGFMLVVPIVGAVFLGLSSLLFRIFFGRSDAAISEEDLSFSKERARMIIGDDMEKDTNIVPIEEALCISDTMERRRAFLEVLKRGDAEDYTVKIRNAMSRNEDTEVVHYAASYITETSAKYKEKERCMRELCEGDKREESLLKYLNFCGKMLKSNLFSQPDKELYLGFYETYMEALYQRNRAKVDGQMLALLLQLKRENDTKNMEKWIERAKERCVFDVAVCKEVLKYYFAIKNKEKFEETLDKIKKSDLVLDSETLSWIRFFG